MNDGLQLDVNQHDIDELKQMKPRLRRGFKNYIERVSSLAAKYASEIARGGGALDQPMTSGLREDTDQVTAWIGPRDFNGEQGKDSYGRIAYYRRREGDQGRAFTPFEKAPGLAEFARRHGMRTDRGGLWRGKIMKEEDRYHVAQAVDTVMGVTSGQLDEVVDKL